MYSNRFVEVVMDSDGRAYPNEKIACHDHHQHDSTQVAVTRVTIAQYESIIALCSRRRREETEYPACLTFGVVPGKFGQSRGLLGWILSRKIPTRTRPPPSAPQDPLNPKPAEHLCNSSKVLHVYYFYYYSH